MNPKRKKRLIIVLGVVTGVAAATALALFALKENANLFFTPSQVANGEAPVGKRIRVGGLVVNGSVKRATDSLKVNFDITDTSKSMTVQYEGILPDLFREGQGIIANGRVNEQGIVVADEVLAKHDEKYMPPEVKHAIEQAGHPGAAPATN
ncbi:MAG TPA: cytochrome c maturation protein CcmE [Pseudomonadales bacterium]|nr:cytochrome c maturation protein CcmE [Pseudomonadales bacterium]